MWSFDEQLIRTSDCSLCHHPSVRWVVYYENVFSCVFIQKLIKGNLKRCPHIQNTVSVISKARNMSCAFLKVCLICCLYSNAVYKNQTILQYSVRSTFCWINILLDQYFVGSTCTHSH